MGLIEELEQKRRAQQAELDLQFQRAREKSEQEKRVLELKRKALKESGVEDDAIRLWHATGELRGVVYRNRRYVPDDSRDRDPRMSLNYGYFEVRISQDSTSGMEKYIRFEGYEDGSVQIGNIVLSAQEARELEIKERALREAFVNAPTRIYKGSYADEQRDDEIWRNAERDSSYRDGGGP